MLQHAGSNGWSDVYRITIYHVGIDEGHGAAMVKNMKTWCPDHQPLWTMVGVAGLARREYVVEIEVLAHFKE